MKRAKSSDRKCFFLEWLISYYFVQFLLSKEKNIHVFASFSFIILLIFKVNAVSRATSHTAFPLCLKPSLCISFIDIIPSCLSWYDLVYLSNCVTLPVPLMSRTMHVMSEWLPCPGWRLVPPDTLWLALCAWLADTRSYQAEAMPCWWGVVETEMFWYSSLERGCVVVKWKTVSGNPLQGSLANWTYFKQYVAREMENVR